MGIDAAAKMQTLETVITGIKQAMAPLSRVDGMYRAIFFVTVGACYFRNYPILAHDL